MATIARSLDRLAPVLRTLHADALAKRSFEFAFWCKEFVKFRLRGERGRFLGVYEPCFTQLMGLSREDFAGKSILDIGCGPKGTLEWADVAKERIGLDPLVDQYRMLGITHHKARYVKAHSESIPFDDGYFDVVACYNALDHVDNIDQTIAEIKRVIAPGGLFLLAVDVNHTPTLAEPVTLPWSIVDAFRPELEPQMVQRYENCGDFITMFRTKANFDATLGENRPGVLVAKFGKPV
jgi:SAM-dependent methyltransferase